MKKYLTLGIAVLAVNLIQAQSSSSMLLSVYNKFAKVQSYKAKVEMTFTIPGVAMKPVIGMVEYKKPSEYRIKTQGISFMPKQSPLYAWTKLSDTTKYDAYEGGKETINGKENIIINLIPHNDSDLVLAKFWIHPQSLLISKSQITTKSNGTVTTMNTYGPQSSYALPDKITFTVDVSKFKIPKALAADFTSSSKKNSNKDFSGQGIITMTLNAYEVIPTK